MTVFVTDLFIISIGALNLSFPVSFRNFLAFRLSNTGAYVSGTKKNSKSQLTPAHIIKT